MQKNIDYIKDIIKNKIEGAWIPEHSAFGHHYKNSKSGRVFDSVTTKIILHKPHLIKWAIKKGIEWLEEGNRFFYLSRPELRGQYMIGAQNAYTDERDDAGSVGTIAHNAIEEYILDWIKNEKQPEDVRDYLDKKVDLRSVASARSAERIFTQYNIVPIASELLVGSEKFKIAGTLDFLCFWDGKLTLADFKTSNHVSDDYAMQVAAYAYCFKEMTGLRIEQAKILHLSKKDDKYTLYRVPYLPDAFKAYRGLSNTYDWIHSPAPKLIKDIKRLKI